MWPGLALLLGTALPYALDAPLAGWAVVLLAASGLLALTAPRTRLLGMLLLGSGWAEWTLQHRLGAWLPATQNGQTTQLEGTVVGLPQSDARSIRFDLQLDPVAGLALRRVRLSWYEGHPPIHAGDRLRLDAKLKRPHGMVNPAGYDFERQALLRGIDATGYVQRGIAAPVAQVTLDALRERGSAALLDTLGDNRGSALLRALVYGDTRALSDRDWRLFRQTGTTHLIAISGSHIGVVAIAAGLLLAWLWRRIRLLQRWPRLLASSIGGTLAAGVYCLLAGFEVPAQRTLIGLAVVTLALLLRRQLSPWHALNAALVAVLLYDPLSPLSAGFWLSFGAVAWLLLIFAQRWRRPPGWRELLESQWKIGILLLPLGALLFQQTSPLALPTNLWAVPLVSLLLVPIALVGTALSIIPGLGSVLLHLAALLADLFLWGLDCSSGAGQPLALSVPTPWVLLLTAGGALLLVAPRGVPGRWMGVLALLPLVWPKPNGLGAGEFDLTVFDVGQGLSVLVRTAEHSVLYDTGPGRDDGEPIAALTVLPSLPTLGVFTLDRIVVSHGDDDHAGGLAAISGAFPHAPVLGSAPEQAAQPCLAGQRWSFDGVQFEFLHPDPGLPYLRNQSSCVLKISGVHGSALLPGDIGRDIEQRLLSRQPDALRADLLVSPHHGSASSSTTAFVQAVDARWVVHASGFQDRFDFPRTETIERYAQAGATQIDTGSAGAVRLRLDAQTGRWRAQALRMTERRRWREPGVAVAP